MKYAILNGYIQTRHKSNTAILAVNTRRLYQRLKNKPLIKVEQINDNLFSIISCSDGRKPRFRNKDFSIYINKTTLKQKELLKNNIKDSSCFPILVKLNPSDFGVDYFDLFPDQDAAKLARELYNRGAIFPERISTSKSSEYDLEFEYKNNQIALEITKTSVSKEAIKNYRHQTLGSRIRANIFDMYKRSSKSLLQEKKILYSFVIISEEWTNIKHINSLIDECKYIGCFIIFTNFKDIMWAKKCANEIITILNGENSEKKSKIIIRDSSIVRDA